MDEATVLLTMADGVARITLNRPEKLNAFDAAMHARLRAVLDQVEAADDIRAVLLTGAGRGFCAGQDLAGEAMEPNGPAPDLGATLEER